MNQFIWEQVQRCLPPQAAHSPCTAHLHADLGLDWLDRFELLIRLENVFQVRLPDRALERVKTLEDLVDSLESHLKRLPLRLQPDPSVFSLN